MSNEHKKFLYGDKHDYDSPEWKKNVYELSDWLLPFSNAVIFLVPSLVGLGSAVYLADSENLHILLFGITLHNSVLYLVLDNFLRNIKNRRSKPKLIIKNLEKIPLSVLLLVAIISIDILLFLLFFPLEELFYLVGVREWFGFR